MNLRVGQLVKVKRGGMFTRPPPQLGKGVILETRMILDTYGFPLTGELECLVMWENGQMLWFASWELEVILSADD